MPAFLKPMYDHQARNILESIKHYVGQDEIIQEYTVGRIKLPGHTCTVFKEVLITILLNSYPKQSKEKSFIIALTDRRLIIAETAKQSYWPIRAKVMGQVKEIPLSEVKGVKAEPGLIEGTLTIHHREANLEFVFWRQYWFLRAENMVRSMSQAR